MKKSLLLLMLISTVTFASYAQKSAKTQSTDSATESKNASKTSAQSQSDISTLCKDIPFDFMNTTKNPMGAVVNFVYETTNHLTATDSKTYKKVALVYLPHNYDENDTQTRYNVLYLMHGGSNTPGWYFGGANSSTRITQLLDALIATGQMEPTIVCAVTYYNDYCKNDTANCTNFYKELISDVIPALESKYHTYAKSTDTEGLAESRYHRAFGGFSMGSVTTWSVFEHCLNEFAYFMPISGDSWSLGNTAGGRIPQLTADYLQKKVLEAGKSPAEFFIYSGCGAHDIAKPNLHPQITAMQKLSDTFIYSDDFSKGNLYEAIYQKGGHDVLTVSAVMYNGLPQFFRKK